MPYLFFFILTLFSTVQAEVIDIDNQQLKDLMAQGVPVIDIRRQDEWRQTGVVKGSHLITFFDEMGRYDVPAWLQELGVIAGKDDPFILICRTGNRTRVVANFLANKLGYQKVYNVKKGITDWIRQGNPTVPPAVD